MVNSHYHSVIMMSKSSVPTDHIVGATGQLSNAEDEAQQLDRLNEAKIGKEPKLLKFKKSR